MLVRSPHLITGGLGFIGSNLALALADKGQPSTLIDSLNPSYGGHLRSIAPVSGSITSSGHSPRSQGLGT